MHPTNYLHHMQLVTFNLGSSKLKKGYLLVAEEVQEPYVPLLQYQVPHNPK